MSTLRASRFSNPAVTPLDASSIEALSLPWDALINNVNNDFDTASTIVDSILTVQERCQVTPFYIQAVIANSSVFLVSNTGSSETLNLTNAGACWLVGKSISCALPVEDSTVDPCHAVIRHTPEAGFFIADVGSQSGTHLNRRRLPPQKRQLLRDGDMIELGNLVVEFFVDNFDRLEEPLETPETIRPGCDVTYPGWEVVH
ncbi:FHA domain-containing protein [Leptothoe sp. PORK10 BA2]|uniref:FHA domain-containing protein n=1 Tax=Leptothoe sp. PORK10 BA2 TaxID=3110254 RepID=UPI002B221142|nr:FHA domain-containing protein [Leptothoe sp. PORK10 BA2]MEA5465118.1 FHA domain-containing protein [Leptothoe sp. PORK10 BA2]